MSQFIEMFGNQNTNDKGWTESLVKDEFKLSMGKTPARNILSVGIMEPTNGFLYPTCLHTRVIQEILANTLQTMQ